MTEEKTEQSAIHIYIKQGIWPPLMELEGKWSFIDLLNVLNYEAEWVRIQLVDKAVQGAMGYTEQMQEVLDQVGMKFEKVPGPRAIEEDEPSKI